MNTTSCTKEVCSHYLSNDLIRTLDDIIIMSFPIIFVGIIIVGYFLSKKE
jgi:hypothetical protein